MWAPLYEILRPQQLPQQLQPMKRRMVLVLVLVLLVVVVVVVVEVLRWYYRACHHPGTWTAPTPSKSILAAALRKHQ